MGERWFIEAELAEMSRPTMDRAIEALDRGDVDAGRAAVRGDEARVAIPARSHGRGDRRSDLVRPGAARRRRRRRGVDLRAGARLEAGRRDDRRARPQADRLRPGGNVARAFVQRHRPASRRVHDHRGRREVHVRDEPVRVRAAARADGALRGTERARRNTTRRTTGATAARASRCTARTARS